jgi:valyl-tRNA synthetase
MKAIELAKAFDPKTFEDPIYARWREQGSFKPGPARRDGAPYVVVIPPPNVTGVLHLGHGLNNSLQDIVVRFHRMRGVQAQSRQRRFLCNSHPAPERNRGPPFGARPQ